LLGCEFDDAKKLARNAALLAGERKVMTENRLWRRILGWALVCAALVAICALRAAPQVAVTHPQGILHGWLVVRSEDGQAIADGELTQTAHGDRVSVRMVLRFKDGSLQDETTEYSQRGRLLLVSDHMIQKGPSFKHAIDMTVERASGNVTVTYTDDDGKQKNATQKMKLPLDLANGMVPTLVQESAGSTAKITGSMVVATPKPRLVKLVITPQGEDSFSTGTASHKATQYSVHIDIGGVAGKVAPMVGKQPPDVHIWIAQGEAPMFVKMEGPMFEGGPVWKVELASPVWPKGSGQESKAGE
jgi:hypothetical protein